MTKTLIRNGTVIDGTGAAGFAADVRVHDGVIAEVAAGLAPAADETVVDATGCIVSPGFIESHTHFDGAMWWDDKLDPLPGYGVTSLVMGNCGVSRLYGEEREAAGQLRGVLWAYRVAPCGYGPGCLGPGGNPGRS